MVCHGSLFDVLLVLGHLSVRLMKDSVCPVFGWQTFFSVAWSELGVKGVGNKLAETQFIHQDIILCTIFVLVFIYFIKR